MNDLTDMIARINALKKKQSKTSKDISEISGVPLGTLNKILSGESKEPTMQNGVKIAHALGVSIDYLIFGQEHHERADKKITDFQTSDEKKLLEDFRKLNDDGKERVLEYTETCSYNPKFTSRGGAEKKA